MIALFAWFVGLAQAHSGSAPVRGVYDWSKLPDLPPGAWVVWDFYPSVYLGVLAFVVGYILLAGPLRVRFALADQGPSRWEWGWFMTSMAVVFFALQGPLHELSDSYLFSAHMVQHLLITLIFPPLFIRGIPGWMWKPLVRHRPVAAFGRLWTHPVVAIVFNTTILYLWHVPAMYDWALFDHNVHIVEHLTFMMGAVVIWWPSMSRIEEVPVLQPGSRMIYLFILTVPMKALGAILTVSDYVLYEFYAVQPRVFGLDPLTDQRVGGLIMWLPGGLVFWLSIGIIFFKHYYGQIAAERGGVRVPAVAGNPS